MLKLILGTDAARVPERKAALDGISAREVLSPSNVTPQMLQALAEGQSLFGDVRAYGITGLFEDESDSYLELLPTLAASVHLFLFEEESGAALAKAVEKAGGKVLKAKAAAKVERSDPFALANALGKRDRKNLWLLYRKAIDDGAAPEMLIGMLAWKARQMISKGDKDARTLSSDLVAAYHDSRRGVGEMELLLEKLILTL